MITLTRKQLRTFRQLMRHAFPSHSRVPPPSVALDANEEGLTIRARSDSIALSWQLAGDYASDQLEFPAEALVRCEGNKAEPVTFQREGKTVHLSWTEDGIPQAAQFPTAPLTVFPELPTKLQPLDETLIAALLRTSETADRNPTRYAIDHLQLRGRSGQVVATDARQALIEGGFVFPWTEDVLVPASRIWGSKELQGEQSVRIGKSGDWITIRSGPWTLQFKAGDHLRFPNVDQQIPARSSVLTTLQLTEVDAEFLLKAINRLPGGNEPTAPVTVDANQAIAIRARAEGERPTELVLSNSRFTGEPVRFTTNRNFLLRAVELGFREIELRGADSPIVCRTEHRTYLWMPLEAGDALEAEAGVTRIASPKQNAKSVAPVPAPATRSVASSPERPRQRSQHIPAKPQPQSPSVIAQAEAVRDSLRTALTNVRELIAHLRKRKKASKLVSTTLASLRELQDVG